MKKYILSAFIGLLGLGASERADAQIFSIAHDTVKFTVNTSANVYDSVINMTATKQVVKWRVVATDFPQNWKDATGICDNVLCYTTSVFNGNSNVADTLQANSGMDFHLQMSLADADPGGHYLTIEVTDLGGTQTDSMTFELVKYANSIKSTVKRDDNPVLYPNPAQKEININVSAISGVRNIAIYNVVGKVVASQKVLGAGNPKVDISSLPQGVYIMRLMNVQGNVISTQKFIHH